MEYEVEMLKIRKEFPGVVACDDINLQIKKGEVHALLGENGAGKSTMMNILFGLYQPDQGTIKIRDQEVQITNPNVANDLGIGMVHQHFKLVHNFSVTENIILGKELKKGPLVDLKTAGDKIREVSKRYGLNVDPLATIENISVGMQQRVEIIKMLYRNAEVLIFDEPTAVLTPQEISELMNIMKNLISEGKSIILITHKLREIKAIADRCTVIRRGKVIGTVRVADTSEEDLAEMMVGRKVIFDIDKNESQPGVDVLKVENLNVKSNRGILGLKDFSLEVRAGEIVGVAGVDGNGQTELVEAITGLRRADSGRIMLGEEDITNYPVRERNSAGLGHIPEDRQKHGLVLDYSVQDNLILKLYYQEPFSRHGLLKREAISQHGSRVIEEFDIRAGQGVETQARSLSGGNQQKTIVAREIEQNPELLIAVQPTRGLDVGAIEYIHKRLIEQRDKGRAVLLISLELDEILGLSDRIVVVNNGEAVGIVQATETNENEIGLMMAGVKRSETA